VTEAAQTNAAEAWTQQMSLKVSLEVGLEVSPENSREST